MTQEQKAIAYDEALKRAKEAADNGYVSHNFVSDIFIELKESNDERIRKEILQFLKENPEAGKLQTKQYSMWIDWLEKQGEHAKFRDSIQVGDKVTRNQDGVLVNLSQLNRVAKKDEKQGEQKSSEDEDREYACQSSEHYTRRELMIYNLGIADGKRMIEDAIKKTEQKPADKVEPKFKIGDTVTVKPMSCHGKVFKGEPFKIVDIIEDNYVSDDGKTYSISLQDGWELVEQKPVEPNWIHHKVDLSDCSEEYRKAYYDGWNNCNQQHEQIKAEQKPALSEEDEEMFTSIIFLLAGFMGSDDKIEWLKSLKGRVQPQPKQEWAEEDLSMIGRIRSIIEKYAFSQSAVDVNGELCEKEFIDADNWLKSLKERVQPQLKQEWSVEDESILKELIRFIPKHLTSYSYNQYYNWAVSHKPQSHWKPSDEQMEYLAKAITTLGNEGDNKTSAILYELRTDLKKLKE